MSTREVTDAEYRIWQKFRERFERKTGPTIQALIAFAKIADSAQNMIYETTGRNPQILDGDTAARINLLGQYAQRIENQITGVIMKKYAIQIDSDGRLNIVAASAPEGDIIPPDPFTGFGGWPIVALIGIAAVTLLVGGWEILSGMEINAKKEAIDLQQKMIAADSEMIKQSPAIRAQWEKWKKQAANAAKQAAASIPEARSLLEKWIGKRGISMAIAGVVGIAGLYFLIPRIRRNG
jgi:hypothetical protein